jgi:hypothetical protein
VFAAFFTGVRRTECNVTWVNHSDVAASAVEYYPQYTTVDECLAACAYQLHGCVAAQVHSISTSMQCYLLTDINRLYATVAARGISLFTLVRSCTPVTGWWYARIAATFFNEAIQFVDTKMNLISLISSSACSKLAAYYL